MHLYRHLCDFAKDDTPLALAIGNFDGFHLGHKAVINTMKEKAKIHGYKSAVMIFEPQPLEYFNKVIPSRLYSIRDKVRAFEKEGIDYLFCMPFNRAFCELSAQEFIINILHNKLNVKSITVGSLFTFGQGGVAGIVELTEIAKSVGVEANAITSIASHGTRVSSTMIRGLIENANFKEAEAMLGHPYVIEGRVVHGNAIGRTIGFPTANVNLHRRVTPLKGVYAVFVDIDGKIYKGMANVGLRPTIYENKVKSLLEVNIFDFSGDIYGKNIKVTFKRKIRDEEKFPDLTSLMAQIKVDAKTALYFLDNINF